MQQHTIAPQSAATSPHSSGSATASGSETGEKGRALVTRALATCSRNPELLADGEPGHVHGALEHLRAEERTHESFVEAVAEHLRLEADRCRVAGEVGRPLAGK